MENQELEELRDRLIAHFANRHHGELKKFAQRLGISRQHLAAFRDGGGISDELASRLSNALAPATSDPAAAIIAELENVILILKSPNFDQDFKVDRFFRRIDELHTAEKSIRAAFSKAKERKK